MIKVKELNNIYKETKYLDEIFDKNNDIRCDDIIEKNILELLVEIGELANETRCFKYWSVKKPSEKNIILEEYIDCIFMILYFCNIYNISLNDSFNEKIENKNIISVFIELYKKSSDLKYNISKDNIKNILTDLLYLGELLNFNIKDLENATKNKSKIIQKRFKENY